MKKSQFFGWFKKAYPDIPILKKTGSTNTFLIKPGFSAADEIIVTENESVLFKPHNRPAACYLDEDIVMVCRNLFGEPSVVFQYSSTPYKQSSQKIENKKHEVEESIKKSEPKKEEKDNNEEKYTKDTIIHTLKEHFGDKLRLVPRNYKIEVYVNDISGPVLGEFGLSPDNKTGYKYIPYTNSENIQLLLTNFFKQFT